MKYVRLMTEKGAGCRVPSRNDATSTGTRHLFLLHLRVEPADEPLDDVAPMFELADAVAFVGIDHQLRVDAERLERVPELERLRRGTLAVTLTDQHQRRR